MRVKICGLTRKEDAELAQGLGAWALGFIFTPKSKRHITPENAAPIVASLDAPAIGVFVNQTDDAIEIAGKIGLKGIQLHGDETPEECQKARANFSGILIKALRPQNENDLAAIETYKDTVDYVLLDAAAGGQYGGTGHTGDWGIAAKAAAFGIPVILAGGLDAQNIAKACAQVRPYAADLASGVEASPGVKDPGKLKALFSAIKGEEE